MPAHLASGAAEGPHAEDKTAGERRGRLSDSSEKRGPTWVFSLRDGQIHRFEGFSGARSVSSGNVVDNKGLTGIGT